MSIPPMADIVLLGATGFTGRLVAHYLASHPERSSFSLGLAARSFDKLEKLHSELPKTSYAISLLVVDALNEKQLDAVLKKSKVVINVSSPYWFCGPPIIRACLKNKVQYLDLAGELLFVGKNVKENHASAKAAGVTIVHLSGFDSVPSDSLVYLSNKALKSATASTGAPLDIEKSITCFRGTGGLSRGTMESIYTMFDNVPLVQIEKGMRDDALSPIPGPAWPLPKLAYSLRDPETNQISVGGMFPLAPLNRASVRRTWGLLQQRAAEGGADHKKASYGPSFKYDEFVETPNRLYGVLLTMSIATFMIAVVIYPLRILVRRIFSNGVGGDLEDEATMESRSFSATNITTSTTTTQHPEPVIVKSTMKGKGDAGYLLTSVIISEAALCFLPESRSKLPPMGREGGVLTPMTALGDVLIARLRKNKRFEFETKILKGGVGENKKAV